MKARLCCEWVNYVWSFKTQKRWAWQLWSTSFSCCFRPKTCTQWAKNGDYLDVGQVHGSYNGNFWLCCDAHYSRNHRTGNFNWFEFSPFWLSESNANVWLNLRLSNWDIKNNGNFYSPDGALKYRNSISQYHPGNGYTNPCLQTSVDQISTISRPRSAADLNGGASMHVRQLNGILSRGANGLHEDPDFPPTPRTLTRKKNVVWMRPHVSSWETNKSTMLDKLNNDF